MRFCSGDRVRVVGANIHGKWARMKYDGVEGDVFLLDVWRDDIPLEVTVKFDDGTCQAFRNDELELVDGGQQ
jgi:hypothetical protein